eukprot:COSAG02_NODE_189_length_30109_cov_71.135855_9_plen_96_part_00
MFVPRAPRLDDSSGYGTQTYGTQIPEVRARAAARGPARSIQPGHIEFGTGNCVLSVCFDGNRFRHVTAGVSAVVVSAVVVSAVVVSVVVVDLVQH